MTEEILPFPASGSALPLEVEMLGVSHCDGSYRIRRQSSGISVLEYVVRGTGTVLRDGAAFHPSAGDAYILRAGEAHEYFSDARDPWEKLWINARGPLIPSLLSLYNLDGATVVPGAARVQPLFEAMLAAGRSGAPYEEVAGRCAILVHEVIAALGALARPAAAVDPGALAMKAALDGPLEREISLVELAALAFRSESGAIRLFRRAFGVTPYEYRMRRRVEAAKLLLRNTALPVRDVALRTGFSDPQYFSGYFKARTGATPRRWRAGGENKDAGS